MAKDVTMPALSPSMTEGTLVRWVKKEGDTIKPGDVLAEVETDKATMDLEAFDAGILRKIIIEAGTKVAVNDRIAIIGGKDEKLDESAPAKKAEPAAAAPKAEAKEEPKAEPNTEAKTEAAAPVTHQGEKSDKVPEAGGRIKASPLAKKVAKEKDVELSSLAGSGPGGRIVKKDVLDAAGNGSAKKGAPASVVSAPGAGIIPEKKRVPLTSMRQVIAKRLLESKTTIPHFYLTVEVDAAPLVALRATLNESLARSPRPIKLTLNDFVLKAAAEALRKVPVLNASFESDAVHHFDHVQLSFAVTIPDGLITPVIREAQNKSIRQISEEARTLATKARDGKLKPEEFTGGTFTISNLGMLGVDSFSAIINPPQAAILAIGNIVKKPVVGPNDEIVVGQRMSITLSCDHRVVDGAAGATYLAEFRALIENPAALLV